MTLTSSPTLAFSKEISQWHTPASKYPRRTLGDWRIKHSSQHPAFYPFWGMERTLFIEVKKRLSITELQQKQLDGRWITWMVDDPAAYTAMKLYAQQAYGNVLVGGLGLGLILHELIKNPAIKSIEVIEREVNVIALILDQLPYDDRLVIHTYSYLDSLQRRDVTQPDTILLDFWTTALASKTSLLGEVFYYAVQTKKKWPDAKLGIHGFESFSDLHLVDQDVYDYIMENRIYVRR